MLRLVLLVGLGLAALGCSKAEPPAPDKVPEVPPGRTTSDQPAPPGAPPAR